MPSIQKLQMDVIEGSKETMIKQVDEVYTLDGSVDSRGQPAVRHKTGKWFAGVVLLVNQGLATLAFFGIGVNLVLFLTRVLGQSNADAANNVSKWTGTVYLFSLAGAFLGDSYWGRHRTCAVFQLIFVMGAAFLSLSTHLLLLKPGGCGDETTRCGAHSSIDIGLFYVSIYLVALGYGGYQPNIATFGADQFDEEYQKEALSKVAFFSYFYLALNLGSLFSNTVLVYYENQGMWVPGFWVSTASIFAALALFLLGTPRFRHFRPSGNPLPRFCQVIVAAIRKSQVQIPEDRALYEVDKDEAEKAGRKMLHTNGFKCLDRAALITPDDHFSSQELKPPNPWHLCPVTQVEEVKCVLRLIPIWLCTILYSVVFTQMASLFVEQGNTMNATISTFQIPAASMSSFDIASVAVSVFLYRRVLNPIVRRTRPRGITELQRMGVGLIIAIMAMISAGVVELYRIKCARKDCINCGGSGSSSLSILWQIPQYALIGASEVFMYVGQLEFFNAQTPDGLKSFGSALCMTSMSLGNYVSSLLVSIVMKMTTGDHGMGWIPEDLNQGHLDRFYFLLAGLTAVDFAVYLVLARWYEDVKKEGDGEEKSEGV